MFVFAFGLSIDYEVFLLSRIKECYDECEDNDTAVASGLRRSRKIITSAALLVIIVFSALPPARLWASRRWASFLAIAVAIDATLVRCLLVPATMARLGRTNWWAPAPLRQLHQRYGLREVPATPQAALTDTTPDASSPSLELQRM